jgi:Flp pilus assembly protein TadG
MTMKSKLLTSRLHKNSKGVALTEFALIAPVFMMTLMGAFDIGYGMYVKAILEGAVENAGRTASLETTQTTVIDDRIRDTVNALNRTGNLNFTRDVL